MDFSRDLVSKRDFTLTSKMLSQAFHCPLIFKSPCSTIALPSIHKLGILLPISESSPVVGLPGNSPISNRLTHTSEEILSDEHASSLRRSRVSSHRKDVLNHVFRQSFFPSTKLRSQLARDLNMTPRAVQIWFQNKRQAWRAKHKKPLPHGDSGERTSTPPLNPYLDEQQYSKVPVSPSALKPQDLPDSRYI